MCGSVWQVLFENSLRNLRFKGFLALDRGYCLYATKTP